MATFDTWIRQQVQRNNPVGDFARDWSSDGDQPKSNRPNEILDYLYSINACDGALEAFQSAWFEFCGEVIQVYGD